LWQNNEMKSSQQPSKVTQALTRHKKGNKLGLSFDKLWSN
jgi:hypothetical protein